MCVCKRACVEAGVFFFFFSFIFLQHTLSLNLELLDSPCTDLPVSPIDPSVSSFPGTGKMKTTRPNFFFKRVFWGSNPGHHACVHSIVLTEPALHPFVLFPFSLPAQSPWRHTPHLFYQI